MNCHGDNQNDTNSNEHKKHGKHMLLMILCCAIPVILLMVLPALKINNAALKSIMPFAVMLLCPLMHIAMIPMMMGKNKKGKHQEQKLNNDYDLTTNIK